MCSLTSIACGRWSLVTNWGEVARRSSWAFKLLELCLYNNNNWWAATNLIVPTVSRTTVGVLAMSDYRCNSKNFIHGVKVIFASRADTEPNEPGNLLKYTHTSLYTYAEVAQLSPCNMPKACSPKPPRYGWRKKSDEVRSTSFLKTLNIPAFKRGWVINAFSFKARGGGLSN